MTHPGPARASLVRMELVRHGQTDWNLAGRVQGSTDIPLNDTGRRQAHEAGRRLAGTHWDLIVSSPLSRARETAEIIAAEIGAAAPLLIAELQERSFGDAEGLTGPELDAKRERGETIDNRERRSAVVQRVRPALEALALEHPGAAILVVTHGGVIGSLVRHATSYAWPVAGQLIENASSHHFAVQDGTLGLIEFAGVPWKPGTVEPDPLGVD